MTATLTNENQLTIPEEVRQRLGLRPGDRVEFILRADGGVEVKAVHGSIRDLAGVLPKPPQAVSLDGMQRAIEDGARR